MGFQHWERAVILLGVLFRLVCKPSVFEFIIYTVFILKMMLFEGLAQS